jgi:hypothetical protein
VGSRSLCMQHMSLGSVDSHLNSFVQTAYLFAWLMLLRIEEVVTLEFTSVEIIPGERRYHVIGSPLLCLTPSHLKGAYIEIRLKTRKSAQTGVLHTWRLWANDADPRLCPV